MKAQKTKSKLYTIFEMSVILGVHEKTVRNKLSTLRISKSATKNGKSLYAHEHIETLQKRYTAKEFNNAYLLHRRNTAPVVITYYIYESKMNNMDKEFIQDVDYYLENGRVIFTAKYLKEQGTCCGNNCDNCPYVPRFEEGNRDLE